MTRQRLKPASIYLIALSLLLTSLGPIAQAESLFRATANFRETSPFTPASLFTPPTPKNVGDMVTVMVEETSSLDSDAELKITRTQVINENGTGLFNGMIRFFTGKLPIGGNTISNIIEAPSFDGLNNQNNMNSKAESSRVTQLRDTVSCQVVQILPNGFLVIQGKKTSAINRDQSEMFVSGIVNPYYLDRFNQIPSTRVANFQLLQGGKGVISRQQSDGIANKIYQFFQ